MKENKTIKILWAIACTSSSVDQKTNTTSLFNILEQVQFTTADASALVNGIVKEGTGVPFQFDIVVLVARSSKSDLSRGMSLEAKVCLLDPDRKILMENKFPGLMEKNKRRLRFNLKFNGMPISRNGDYTFLVSVKEKDEKNFSEEVEIPLEVSLGIVSPGI
ncbi:MAG: hypothetical protein KGJ34_01765 [Patescibacteria group bacterium]|nr:hypothetical protein [Patescibacteria group bacterium]